MRGGRGLRPEFWAAVSAVAESAAAFLTLIAVAVSLFLLRQGQQDRRRVEEERRRSQALDVILRLDDPSRSEPLRHPERARYTSLVVSNNSVRPIVITGVTMYLDGDDGTELPHVTRRDLFDLDAERVVGPKETMTLAKQFRDHRAVVTFRDHGGIEWDRSSEGMALRLTYEPERRRHRLVRRLCEIGLLQVLLINIWVWSALRSAERDGPNRLPFGLRLVVFLLGFWPLGEKDRWSLREHEEVPRLWSYDEIFEVAIRRRTMPEPSIWNATRTLDVLPENLNPVPKSEWPQVRLRSPRRGIWRLEPSDRE